MTKVKRFFDGINSVLCAVLCCVTIVMAAGLALHSLGECEASERDAVITEDSLRLDYMSSIGTEYEDILVLDYSVRYDGDVSIYDSCEVTQELLENRTGNVIIERCYGKVLNPETGDGKVLNAYDEDYDYISYRNCKEIHEGTLMMTYLVYNPDSTYTDDIIERYDCVVSHELED